MLSRADLLAVTGITESRFAALKRRDQFPVFVDYDKQPEDLGMQDDDTVSGARRFRTRDAFGVMLLAMATDGGDEMGDGDEDALVRRMVARFGAPDPGRLQAGDAVRMLRAVEKSLSLVMPSILHPRADTPDMHIAAAVVAQPAPYEANPKTELEVGALTEVVARFSDNPIVGRGPRVVSRLFTLNASEAWRRMIARAAEHGVALGV